MSLGDSSTPSLETDPHAYVPPLQAYSEWSTTNGSSINDPLSSYRGYADYQRGHFFRTGEIDNEVESAIQQGFHTNILDNGLSTPEELQKPEVMKALTSTGASVDAEVNIIRRAFGEEAGSTYLNNSQSGAANQPELIKQLNMAKTLLVDTGGLSFASITDDQGRTKVIGGNDIVDRNKALDESVRAGAMDYSHAYLAAEGLKQGASETSTRFQDLSRANLHNELGALFGSDSDEDSEMHDVLDNISELVKARDTDTDTDNEYLDDYIGTVRAGLSRNYGSKNGVGGGNTLNRYSDKQIKNALEEKAALEVNAKNGFEYYKDDDTKNIRILNSGLAIAHPKLMEQRDKFEKAVENDSRLTQSQRSMLRNSRNLFREQSYPHFDKILSDTSATSDEWLEAKQAGRVNGAEDVDVLDAFLSDKENYSAFTNRAGSLAASVWDGIGGMFASVGAVVFKSEGATNYLVEKQRDVARRREVAALFGDDFGWFMDLGEAIAPMVTDVAATAMLSAATFGAGGVAYVSLKTGARVGARGLVKSMSGRLLRKQFGETSEQAASNLVAKGLIKASTKKAAEEGAQKAIIAYNKALASKLWTKAATYPPLFLTSANRSAGGTYATIYGAQPDSMTHDEKHDAALGYALMSGMTTGLITTGFSALGRGGFEDALLGGMTYKRMVGSLESVGRVKFTGAGAEKINKKISSIIADKIKDVTKRKFPEFIKGGLNEALEEGADEFAQTFIMDAALNENTPMIDRVMIALHAASLGGALGAGATGVRSLMDKGKGSQYMAYEQRAIDDVVAKLKESDSPLTAAFTEDQLREPFMMAARERNKDEPVTVDVVPEAEGGVVLAVKEDGTKITDIDENNKILSEVELTEENIAVEVDEDTTETPKPQSGGDAISAPTYTAAILEDSGDALSFWESTVKEPLLSKSYAHHMTIDFKPTDEQFSDTPIGEEAELKVVGYASDSKVQVLVVKPVGVNSSNTVAHITIATDGTTSPAYSNKLLEKGYTKVDGPTLTAQVGYVDNAGSDHFTTRQSQGGALDGTPEQMEEALEERRQQKKELIGTFDNLWNDEELSAEMGGNQTPEEHHARAEEWAADAEKVAANFGMDSVIDDNINNRNMPAFRAQSIIDGPGMTMVISPWGLARLTAGLSKGNAQHLARTEAYHEVIHHAAWRDLSLIEMDVLFSTLSDSHVNEILDTYYGEHKDKKAEHLMVLSSPKSSSWSLRDAKHMVVDEDLRMRAQRILKGYTSEEDMAFYKSNPNFVRVFLRYLTSVVNRLRAARELNSDNPVMSAALTRLTGEMARMKGSYQIVSDIKFDVDDPDRPSRVLASQFGEASPERQYVFEEDEKYMALAKDEKANEEELQLMVDERAQDAGFNVGPAADPVTRDDDGNIIPLRERFNATDADIRYSQAGAVMGPLHETPIEFPKELFSQGGVASRRAIPNKDYSFENTGGAFENVPKIDVYNVFEDFRKKYKREPKVWVWMGDQLKRGVYENPKTEAKVNLEGGIGYPLDPVNRESKRIWASGINFESLKENSEEADFIWIASGTAEGAHNYSKGTSKVIVAEINQAMKIAKKKAESFSTGKGKSIKIKDGTFEEFAEHVTKWLPKAGKTVSGQVTEALRSGEGLIDGNGTTRKHFARNILAETRGDWSRNIGTHHRFNFIHNFLGIPTKDELRKGILEPFNIKNNINTGDLTILLKPESAIKDGGVHDTYGHAVTGEVMGMPTKRYNIFDIASTEVVKQAEKAGSDPVRQMILVPSAGRMYGADESGKKGPLVFAAPPDREIMMGITTFTDADSFEREQFELASVALIEEIKKDEGVTDVTIQPTEGVYFGDSEPSYDVRINATEGADLTALMNSMNEFGKQHEQYDVFMTEEVSSAHPNARPAVNILFKNPITDNDIDTLFTLFASHDLEGFTVLKDEQGNSIGVVSQIIPEIGARWDEAKKKEVNDLLETGNNLFILNHREKLVRLLADMRGNEAFELDAASVAYYNTAVYGKEEYDRSVIEPLGSRRRGSEFRRRIRGVGDTQAQEETPATDTDGAEGAVQSARAREGSGTAVRGSVGGGLEADYESISENAQAHTFLDEEYDPWNKDQGIAIWRNGVKLTGTEAYHAIKQEDAVIAKLQKFGVSVDNERKQSRRVIGRQAAIDFLKGRGYTVRDIGGERLSLGGVIPAKKEAEYMDIAKATKPSKEMTTATKQLWEMVQVASKKAESVVPEYLFYEGGGGNAVEVIKNPSASEIIQKEVNYKSVISSHYILTPGNKYLFDREHGQHGWTAKALGVTEWMGITTNTYPEDGSIFLVVAEYTPPSPLYWDNAKGDLTKLGSELVKKHFPSIKVDKYNSPKSSSKFNPVAETEHYEFAHEDSDDLIEIMTPVTLTDRFSIKPNQSTPWVTSTARFSQAGGLEGGVIPRYNPSQAELYSPIKYGSISAMMQIPFFDTGKYHKKKTGGMKWLNSFTGGIDPRVQRLVDQNKQINRAVSTDITDFQRNLKHIIKKQYTDKGLAVPTEAIKAISGDVNGVGANEGIMEMINDQYNKEISQAKQQEAAGTITTEEREKEDAAAAQRKKEKETKELDIARKQFDKKKTLAIEELGGVDNEIVNHILSLRGLVNELSLEVKKLFGYDLELGATIDANMDIYLHRAYRLFTDVDYAKRLLGGADMSPDEAEYFEGVRERAGQVFAKNYAEHRANQTVSEYASWEDAKQSAEAEIKNDPTIVNGLIMDYIQSLTGGARAGSPALTLMGVEGSPESRKGISKLVTGGLMKRSNPPKEIRELLGEYEDTTGYNTLLRTYMHVGLMASKQSFVQHMFDLGTRSEASRGEGLPAMSDTENKWIYTQSEMNALTAEEKAEIGELSEIIVGGDKADQFDPFRRVRDDEGNVIKHYAPKEMVEGIQALLNRRPAPVLDEADAVAKALITVASKATGLSLAAKTLGSAGFYVRNVVSNIIFFGPSQGFWRFGKMSKSFSVEMRRKFLRMSPQEVSAFHRTMNAIGVGGNEMKKRLIEELIEKTPSEAELLGRLNKTMDEFTEAGGDKKSPSEIVADSKLGKIYDNLKELSATVDVFYKITYFMHELETLQRARDTSKKNGVEDKYTKMSDFQLMDAAGEKVKRTAQSYDQAPPFVAGAQRTWFGTFFAPFLRFKMEVPRIILNTVRLSVSEIKDANPVIKSRGIKRLTGLSTVVAGLSAILPLVLRGISGIGEEEDEALRDSMPEYLRTHTFFYTGKGDKLKSWDITYLNPYAMMVDPFLRSFEQMFRGNPAKAGSQFAKAMFADNFLDDQILAGAVMHLKNNRDPKTDRPIWEENDTAWDAAYKSAWFLIDSSYNPRTPKNVYIKGFKKLQEEGIDDLNILTTPVGALLSEFKPVRQHDVDLEAQFNRFLSTRRAEYNRVISRKNKMLSDKSMDASDIRELAADEIKHRRRINQHISKSIRGFHSLGLSNAQLFSQAKERGFGQRRMALLFAGLMDRPALRLPFVERMATKGDIHIKRLREFQKELDTYAPYISLD